MTIYKCSNCGGVHDSSEPSCMSATVRPIGIGTHNVALIRLVDDSERMRRVYDAAMNWASTMDFNASRSPGEIFTCELMLLDALGVKP